MAFLRDLTGRDEYHLSGVDTANAVQLLSALLDSPLAGESDRISAGDLVAADRDRLLAAVYEGAFGDRIEGTLTCAKCNQPFDLHFSLRRLIDSVNQRMTPAKVKSLGDGRFETEGLTFRLPTGADELTLAGRDSAEAESTLRERCAEGVARPQDQAALEDLLERVAPLLDLELLASCAECNHVHTVQFDIQSYVLGAIVGERRRLLSEINRIAGAYAWSLDEILSLSRNDRRQFVELIENEYVT